MCVCTVFAAVSCSSSAENLFASSDSIASAFSAFIAGVAAVSSLPLECDHACDRQEVLAAVC